MLKYICFLPLLFFASHVYTQTKLEQYQRTDVQHYRFSIRVTDDNDTIQGEAAITVRFLQQSTYFLLDLVNQHGSGKGMQVLSVEEEGKPVSYEHSDTGLLIQTAVAAGSVKTYTIRYAGVPADGLIISKNKYGHRTLFADNWPNRAHNWIPCKDHPSDKSTVEFIITAPDHYRVVANGLLKEESALPDHLKKTHWSEGLALPVKVMAVGIADFAVSDACYAGAIPVYSYVYPENQQAGFYDYGFACSILPWYVKWVGPYPFEKLANVQSKTIFGGLENASAIFYAESSVRGNGKAEALLAHEIAHQWFGDAATETDWQHIWLSEGFATYMTNLYLESKYGRDTLVERLNQDRGQVISFSKVRSTAVVDGSVRNAMELLNVNSYQKGGWILHMLRCQLGMGAFQKGIRNYFAAFSGKNATTEDLQKELEKASGKDLQQFFHQWLYTPGQPQLKTAWQYDSVKRVAHIIVTQMQPDLFSFPLKLKLVTANKTVIQTFSVTNKETRISLPAGTRPQQVVLDPDVELLHEEAK
ncbi:MAG: M1 family metallopeptidase [Williamsia sp.]|nr:M1 family metallopeptidase [Williamsia sp.]